MVEALPRVPGLGKLTQCVAFAILFDSQEYESNGRLVPVALLKCPGCRGKLAVEECGRMRWYGSVPAMEVATHIGVVLG